MYDTCYNSQKHNSVNYIEFCVTNVIFLRLKRSSYGTSLLTTYTGDYVHHLVQRK